MERWSSSIASASSSISTWTYCLNPVDSKPQRRDSRGSRILENGFSRRFHSGRMCSSAVRRACSDRDTIPGVSRIPATSSAAMANRHGAATLRSSSDVSVADILSTSSPGSSVEAGRVASAPGRSARPRPFTRHPSRRSERSPRRRRSVSAGSRRWRCRRRRNSVDAPCASRASRWHVIRTPRRE
jgi:hypothetical protein